MLGPFLESGRRTGTDSKSDKGGTYMRRLLLAASAASLLVPSLASAQVYVQGYTRNDGTYVAPHYRSSPNSSTYDNYSTRGNVNPYTGQAGTRDPNYRPSTSTYRTQRRSSAPCYYNCPDD